MDFSYTVSSDYSKLFYSIAPNKISFSHNGQLWEIVFWFGYSKTTFEYSKMPIEADLNALINGYLPVNRIVNADPDSIKQIWEKKPWNSLQRIEWFLLDREVAVILESFLASQQ